MIDDPEVPKLYTEQEVAEHLGIDPETLVRERREGKIAYVKVRGRPRYTARHVEEYLKRNERLPE